MRETFEECGVLLAVDRQGRPATRWPTLARDRVALDEGRLGLGELLRMRQLALDPRLIPLVGHWITPEAVERRFDTRFFAAELPAGQTAGEVGSESDGSGWWAPAAAVAASMAGALPMMAPTVASLRWLATYDTVAAVLAAGPELLVRPLLPRPVPDGAGGVRWQMTDGRTGAELAPADTAVTAAAADITAEDAAGVGTAPGRPVPDGVGPAPGSSGPWSGGMVTESATCLLAPNPGPMTLDGTNTWLLLAPGARDALVVDPGPAHEAHLQSVRGRGCGAGRPGRRGAAHARARRPQRGRRAARRADRGTRTRPRPGVPAGVRGTRRR